MRENIFRGKRKDNNEYVFGDLIQLDDYTLIAGKEMSAMEYLEHSESLELQCVSVFKESISQFTGLKDIENNDIFENDKVWAFGSVCTIVYGDGAFFVKKGTAHFRLSRVFIQSEEIKIYK